MIFCFYPLDPGAGPLLFFSYLSFYVRSPFLNAFDGFLVYALLQPTSGVFQTFVHFHAFLFVCFPAPERSRPGLLLF